VWLDLPQGNPRFKEPTKVWVAQVAETKPPEGIEPIEWILLTSEEVHTLEQACQRVGFVRLPLPPRPDRTGTLFTGVIRGMQG